MDDRYGFSGFNDEINSDLISRVSTNIGKLKGGQITPARVKSIILDSSHPLWDEVGQYNGIGTIEYQSIIIPTLSGLSLAKPFFTNNRKYPLINEIVYLVSFPNTDLLTTTTSKSTYYIDVVGLWNSPHHNAYPSNPNEPSPEQQKDYVETEAGNVRRVTDQSTEIDLGNTFVERANIHPLQAYEGDIIYEGRWGNSIRFGSTVTGFTNWSSVGENGDPIILIRNGQGEQSDNGWVTINENINNDDSSIYLTSTQNIPLQPSTVGTLSKSYPKDPPENIDQYSGKQILLNSGRLVFNTNEDHILLSSNLSIGLKAVQGINIDTNGYFITNSPDIRLGGKEATEPILKGDTTIELLSQLVEQLTNLTKLLQLITPTGGPGVSQGATALIPFLQTLKVQLETTTKSKISKTL